MLVQLLSKDTTVFCLKSVSKQHHLNSCMWTFLDLILIQSVTKIHWCASCHRFTVAFSHQDSTFKGRVELMGPRHSPGQINRQLLRRSSHSNSFQENTAVSITFYTKIMSQQNAFGTVHSFVRKTVLWLKGGFAPAVSVSDGQGDVLSLLDFSCVLMVCEHVLMAQTRGDQTKGYDLMCIKTPDSSRLSMNFVTFSHLRIKLTGYCCCWRLLKQTIDWQLIEHWKSLWFFQI